MQLKVKKASRKFYNHNLINYQTQFYEEYLCRCARFLEEEIMHDIKEILEELCYGVCIKQVILKQDTNIASLVSNTVIQFFLSNIDEK